MNYDKNLYLNPSVTVDTVIFTYIDNTLKVLLSKRDKDPFKGFYALPGGFMLKEEDSKHASIRLLKEKADFSREVYLEQLYTFDTKDRDPRGSVISITYMALVPSHLLETQTENFFDVKDLPKLGFDHKDIILYAVERLKNKFEYTNSAFALLPEYFIFSDLHILYQTVFNSKFDIRNFSRKILALDFIELTDKIFKGGRRRPARMYRFKNRKSIEYRRIV